MFVNTNIDRLDGSFRITQLEKNKILYRGLNFHLRQNIVTLEVTFPNESEKFVEHGGEGTEFRIQLSQNRDDEVPCIRFVGHDKDEGEFDMPKVKMEAFLDDFVEFLLKHEDELEELETKKRVRSR